jgi:hypothetical protein
MARVRDYASEYARRIERGRRLGRSRPEARGHGTKPNTYDPKLEEGIKGLRKGKSLRAAAKEARVAPERLQKYVRQTGVVEKERGRYVVKEDLRPRRLLLFSKGQKIEITVPGYAEARLVGDYMAAVKQFLRTNDRSHLEPFEGKSVADTKGRKHAFETRRNTLYRLNLDHRETFHQIYRIVA